MLLKFNKNINKLLLFTVILVIIFIFLGTNIVKLVVNKQFMMEGFENDQPQERIPKVIHQIWIGPREPPTKWINRWKDDYTKMYPDFSHVMWNEEKINKDLNIDVYLGGGILTQDILSNLQLRASYNMNDRLRITRSGGFTDARNQTSPSILLSIL